MMHIICALFDFEERISNIELGRKIYKSSD